MAGPSSSSNALNMGRKSEIVVPGFQGRFPVTLEDLEAADSLLLLTSGERLARRTQERPQRDNNYLMVALVKNQSTSTATSETEAPDVPPKTETTLVPLKKVMYTVEVEPISDDENDEKQNFGIVQGKTI